MSHGVHTRVHALTLGGGKDTRLADGRTDQLIRYQAHGHTDQVIRYSAGCVRKSMFDSMRGKYEKICYLEFEHFEFVILVHERLEIRR